MTDESRPIPAEKKFRICLGAGGACVVLGLILMFTIFGIPFGIPLVVIGIVLLIVGPIFKARHLTQRRPERDERQNK